MTSFSWTAALCAAVLLSGCAFGPGSPFGEVKGDLDARYTVPAERERPEGFARLASDYELRIDAATLRIESVELRTLQGVAGGGGGAGAAFDPANPPPGYSLCHGGHCHRSDGALVPYAEVEAELASGGAVSEAAVVRFPIARTVDLLEGLTLSLDGSCEPDCDLERGVISSAFGRVSALRIEGVVRDGRPQPRIEGLQPFVLEVDALTMRAPLELELNRDEPPRVALRLNFHPSPRSFDTADWATDIGLTGESRDEVMERLATQLLSVEISRSR